MRIISQYKDYYDFLTGIYGVDDKIILDRREYSKVEISLPTKVILHVCNCVYEGFYKDGKFYWCSAVLQLLTENEIIEFEKIRQKDKNNPVVTLIREGKKWNHPSIRLNPYCDSKTNIKENCPILLGVEKSNIYWRFPMLKELGVVSILPPKDIYLMLSEWLAPKEDFTDTRTDKEKITGAGFDLKTSFRKL